MEQNTVSNSPLAHPATLSSICLYTEQFASILASQVTSKLILMPLNKIIEELDVGSNISEPESCFLSLWILSPSIYYSFTSGAPSSVVSGQHAMKVFFQTPSAKQATILAGKQDVEEVFLPVESILELRKALVESSARLPQSARRFGLWDVGLLDRFSAR